MTHEHDVVVVGAGFSGIGMAARLRSMGIDDFVILDRGNDLGGTWRDNAYPGAACDVPSNLYSYSFALNPDWSRSFPPQAEIWDYLRACVDHFGVGDRLRFGQTVDEARWDGEAERWVVRVTGGEEYRAPVLVWATGSLSEPSIPDFPGLASFRGKVFHSARWEHGFDLAGKRVCVVGTGASAVQFVPQIAPVVGHLYLHQRTPPWIFPRRDRSVSRLRKAAYHRVPALQRLSRLRTYATFESLLSVFVGQGERRKAVVRKAALEHLARQVPDESLRRTLTPQYEPGCKRILLSDDYYPSLTRSNVEVVDSPVASFSAHEVVGQDGIARPVDVVIMGTGFEAAEPPYAEHIVGRGRRAAVRGLEGQRCRGVRRVHRGRVPQPLPDDRAELDAGPQFDDLHDRVAHQLHRRRVGLPAPARRRGRRAEASRAAPVQRAVAGEARALRLGGGRLRQLVPRPSRQEHHAVAGPHLEVPAAHPALSPG